MVAVGATAVVTFAGTWALVIAQRRRQKQLSYDIFFSGLVIPLETSVDDDLQVLIREGLLVDEYPADGSGQLVPAGRV